MVPLVKSPAMAVYRIKNLPLPSCDNSPRTQSKSPRPDLPSPGSARAIQAQAAAGPGSHGLHRAAACYCRYTGMVLTKASFSACVACGPSGLLGLLSLNRRRDPHPRLFRVSAPVTGFTPSAYRHNACDNDANRLNWPPRQSMHSAGHAWAAGDACMAATLPGKKS
jgi:hypothetical protein